MIGLVEVRQRLDAAGIEWAVFAGAAAQAYGSKRPLTDVDILVPAAERKRVEALLPEAEVVDHPDGRQSLLLPGIDILPGLALVDLDEAMARRLTRHALDGVDVPIIPPEDNILLKAMWGRGVDEGKHDWEDVEAMMYHLSSLDWEYLRWRAKGIAPRRRAEQVLDRLDRLWQQTGKARAAERQPSGGSR